MATTDQAGVRWGQHPEFRYHCRPLPVEGPDAEDTARVLDQLIRRQLALIASDCRRLPDRAFTEACGRAEQRPLGTITLARALIAARRVGVGRERLLAVSAAVEAFVLSLYPQAASVSEAWSAECRQQAEADIAQSAVFVHGDYGRLDAAIEETIQELAAKRALLATLIASRVGGAQ